MKVRELFILQRPCGKVQLNRGGCVARRQLRVMLNQIGICDIEIAAAGDIALKDIRLVEQRIEHKEATR